MVLGVVCRVGCGLAVVTQGGDQGITVHELLFQKSKNRGHVQKILYPSESGGCGGLDGGFGRNDTDNDTDNNMTDTTTIHNQ
jgi:hypothetical protein